MEEVHSPPPHLQPDGESSRVSAGGAIPSRSRSAQHQLRRVSSTSLGRLPAPQLDPRSRSADRRATDSLLVQAPTRQPRDNKRFVALPLDFREEEEELEEGAQEALGLIEGSPAAGDGTDDKQLQQHTEPDFAGRITVMTLCDAFRREEVSTLLSTEFPGSQISRTPEVIHLTLPDSQDTGTQGDVFVFDYGVLVCWSLDVVEEVSVLKALRQCQVKPLPPAEVQKEELGLHVSTAVMPHIQNDIITLSRREARDSGVKLAVSHALAQSSKLLVYEERVWQLVEKVRHLPASLARHGEIRMPRKQMAQLLGCVFLCKSEVNLLSCVLDTPEFFWRASDALRALYDRVCEYIELEERVALVNSRTMLIQTMLNIWSDHQHHHYIARLDRIIIVLIIVEVFIAAAEVVGYFYHRVA